MNEVVEFAKSLIPVRIEAVWGAAVGVCGTLTSYLFGEWNNALDTLLMLMMLDYVSGLLAAYINPKLALNSQKGFKGIARKMFILLIVAIAHRLDLLLGISSICTMATFFYAANEGLSITENAAKAGVPIPDAIKKSLEQLAQQKKARGDKGVK